VPDSASEAVGGTPYARGKSVTRFQNLIFSMPPGTSPKAVLRAVKKIAVNSGRCWSTAMRLVLHTNEQHPHADLARLEHPSCARLHKQVMQRAFEAIRQRFEVGQSDVDCLALDATDITVRKFAAARQLVLCITTCYAQALRVSRKSPKDFGRGLAILHGDRLLTGMSRSRAVHPKAIASRSRLLSVMLTFLCSISPI